MHSTTTQVAGALEGIGALLAVGLNAPQAWRSCYRRKVAGLLPAARWMTVLQASTWLVFGLTGGGSVQVATNGVCLALHVGVLTALLALAPESRCRRVVVPQATAAATWLVVVLWSAATGALSVGALAATCGTVAQAPQLLHLARSGGADASGVSPLTLSLGLASGACWTSYGLLAGSAAVVVPSLLSVLAQLATLALVRRASTSPVCDVVVLAEPVRPRAALAA